MNEGYVLLVEKEEIWTQMLLDVLEELFSAEIIQEEEKDKVHF